MTLSSSDIVGADFSPSRLSDMYLKSRRLGRYYRKFTRKIITKSQFSHHYRFRIEP
jgi:hypothetical protein